MSQAEVVDGRRARGDVTRQAVARAAARAATVEGLDSITVGGLAATTGVSKSGILTVFGSREAIQIAAVAEARRLYQEWVVLPAWDLPAGSERLTALIEHWVAYTKADVFPGGCFFAAASFEFNRRPGAVRDRIQHMLGTWISYLEHAVEQAQQSGEILQDVGARELAFELDAFAQAANARYQLFEDTAVFGDARRAIRERLESLRPRP